MSTEFWLFAIAAICAGIEAFRLKSLLALAVGLLAAGFAVATYHN